MSRTDLYRVLDDAVGDTPRVDLAEAAWAQGVGMRRRRRVAFAGGGTVLAAAAVVGALVISGGLAPDGDVAPAVPTSSPGPTDAEPTSPEPAPVDDIAGAHTFLFERDGTRMQIETTTLGVSLDEQPVPTDEDLVGTSWNLVSDFEVVAGAEEFIHYTIADASTVGVDAPTSLTFRDRAGDTLLGMGTGCAGPGFQEDLDLDAEGHFAGQPADMLAVGCDGPDSGGFWADALQGGGWLHQPSEDVLLLSVIVPEDAAPTQERTEDADPTQERTEAPTVDQPADLAQARTLAFRRPGTDAAFDVAAAPPLTEQEVPSLEEISGIAWELIPIDQPWYDEGPHEANGIHILESEDFGTNEDGVQSPAVATELHLEAGTQGALLSIDLAGCGGSNYTEPMAIEGDGRFAGQPPVASDGECDQPVQVAQDLWMNLLPQGGWLHQPSSDVLLLSIVAPEGLLPEVPPAPEAPDPTQGVAALGIGDGLPDGWSNVVLNVDLERQATTSCLLPEGESTLFGSDWCTAGVEVRTGIDSQAADASGWWDPADPSEFAPPEQCYVTRQDYGAPDNAVTFASPEVGSATIADQPVEWLRWHATCAEGQEFTAEAWRVTDLGIQLRSTDGSQEVEPLVRALLEDGGPSTIGLAAIEVTEPIGDTLTGELQVWEGAYLGTGEQVTFTITDDTQCLITRPGGELGVDLEMGSCADLMLDLEESPIAQVIVTPDGEVLTVRVPSTF